MTQITDQMIDAFVRASDTMGYGAEKGSFLWEQTENGLRAALLHVWQPIETAPKDGKDILIATQYGVRVGFWDHAREGVWSIWPGRAKATATHWMPLPAPPLSSAQDKGAA